MSLISRIIHGIFGDSETTIKTAALKSAEAIAEAFLPEGATIAAGLLASKGFVIPEAEVQEVLSAVLKGLEAKAEGLAGVPAAQ